MSETACEKNFYDLEFPRSDLSECKIDWNKVFKKPAEGLAGRPLNIADVCKEAVQPSITNLHKCTASS